MESGSFTMPAAASGTRMTAAAAMLDQSMGSSSSMGPSPVADQQSVLLLQQPGAPATTIPATVTVVPIQQQQPQQLPHSGALTVDAVQQQQQQQQMAAMQQVMNASGVRSATLVQQQTAGASMLQQVVAAPPTTQVVNVVPAQVGLQTMMTADGLSTGQLQTVPVNLQTVSASGVVTTQQVHLIQQGPVTTPPDLQQAVAAAAGAQGQAGATMVVHTPPDVAQLSHSSSRQLQHSNSVASQNQIAMKQAAIQQVG